MSGLWAILLLATAFVARAIRSSSSRTKLLDAATPLLEGAIATRHGELRGLAGDRPVELKLESDDSI